MKKHNLFDVDLERKTALCAVCGSTEIYIPNTRKRTRPKPICINRARGIWLHSKEKLQRERLEKRSNPDWKPKHFLSEIDTNSLTAMCAICGPTDIRRITRWGYSRYDCLTKTRSYMRRYHRNRYIARSTNPHALSEIDEENQTAVCAKCGPVKIEIRHGKRKITRRCINAKEHLKHEKK